MQSVTCLKCGLVDDYKTERKANNDVAYCNGCGAYIKNIPRSEPALYIGKYKNIPIKDIEDIPYLKWAIKELKLSQHVRTAIEKRISEFENLAR